MSAHVWLLIKRTSGRRHHSKVLPMQPIKIASRLAALLLATAPFGRWDERAAGEDVSLSQLKLADARPVRHCHNTPRRVYCHTREVLPLSVPSSATVKT